MSFAGKVKSPIHPFFSKPARSIHQFTLAYGRWVRRTPNLRRGLAKSIWESVSMRNEPVKRERLYLAPRYYETSGEARKEPTTTVWRLAYPEMDSIQHLGQQMYGPRANTKASSIPRQYGSTRNHESRQTLARA